MKPSYAAWSGPDSERVLTISKQGSPCISVGPADVASDIASERMVRQFKLIGEAAKRMRTDWGYSGLHADGLYNIVTKLDEGRDQ